MKLCAFTEIEHHPAQELRLSLNSLSQPNLRGDLQNSL